MSWTSASWPPRRGWPALTHLQGKQVAVGRVGGTDTGLTCELRQDPAARHSGRALVCAGAVGSSQQATYAGWDSNPLPVQRSGVTSVVAALLRATQSRTSPAGCTLAYAPQASLPSTSASCVPTSKQPIELVAGSDSGGPPARHMATGSPATEATCSTSPVQ